MCVFTNIQSYVLSYFLLCHVMSMKGHSKLRERRTRINSYHVIPSPRKKGGKEGPKQIPDIIKKYRKKTVVQENIDQNEDVLEQSEHSDGNGVTQQKTITGDTNYVEENICITIVNLL